MKNLIIYFVLVLNLANAQKINTTLTYSINIPTIKTAKTPVLIIMHGYGSDENDFLDLAKKVDGRFMTFCLRAPNSMQGSGYCWYEIQFLANGDFKYSYDQVKQSRSKILSFISNACKVYQLDSTQVFLMGFSQGAIMSYELALFAPNKIKAALPLSGRLLTESKAHKNNPQDITKLNFFIAHGTSDERIKILESEKAVTYLQEKKIKSIIFKKYNMGHTLSNEEVDNIKEFLSGAIN
jgi:phospholipase/carboxylesterase